MTKKIWTDGAPLDSLMGREMPTEDEDEREVGNRVPRMHSVIYDLVEELLTSLVYNRRWLPLEVEHS